MSNRYPRQRRTRADTIAPERRFQVFLRDKGILLLKTERGVARIVLALVYVQEKVMHRALDRIRAEFLEMPGLRLTIEQAHRLCGVEQSVCAEVLDELVEYFGADRL